MANKSGYLVPPVVKERADNAAHSRLLALTITNLRYVTDYVWGEARQLSRAELKPDRYC